MGRGQWWGFRNQLCVSRRAPSRAARARRRRPFVQRLTALAPFSCEPARRAGSTRSCEPRRFVFSVVVVSIIKRLATNKSRAGDEESVNREKKASTGHEEMETDETRTFLSSKSSSSSSNEGSSSSTLGYVLAAGVKASVTATALGTAF